MKRKRDELEVEKERKELGDSEGSDEEEVSRTAAIGKKKQKVSVNAKPIKQNQVQKVGQKFEAAASTKEKDATTFEKKSQPEIPKTVVETSSPKTVVETSSTSNKAVNNTSTSIAMKHNAKNSEKDMKVANNKVHSETPKQIKEKVNVQAKPSSNASKISIASEDSSKPHISGVSESDDTGLVKDKKKVNSSKVTRKVLKINSNFNTI